MKHQERHEHARPPETDNHGKRTTMVLRGLCILYEVCLLKCVISTCCFQRRHFYH